MPRQARFQSSVGSASSPGSVADPATILPAAMSVTGRPVKFSEGYAAQMARWRNSTWTDYRASVDRIGREVVDEVRPEQSRTVPLVHVVNPVVAHRVHGERVRVPEIRGAKEAARGVGDKAMLAKHKAKKEQAERMQKEMEKKMRAERKEKQALLDREAAVQKAQEKLKDKLHAIEDREKKLKEELRVMDQRKSQSAKPSGKTKAKVDGQHAKADHKGESAGHSRDRKVIFEKESRQAHHAEEKKGSSSSKQEKHGHRHKDTEEDMVTDKRKDKDKDELRDRTQAGHSKHEGGKEAKDRRKHKTKEDKSRGKPAATATKTTSVPAHLWSYVEPAEVRNLAHHDTGSMVAGYGHVTAGSAPQGGQSIPAPVMETTAAIVEVKHIETLHTPTAGRTTVEHDHATAAQQTSGVEESTVEEVTESMVEESMVRASMVKESDAKEESRSTEVSKVSAVKDTYEGGDDGHVHAVLSAGTHNTQHDVPDERRKHDGKVKTHHTPGEEHVEMKHRNEDATNGPIKHEAETHINDDPCVSGHEVPGHGLSIRGNSDHHH